MIDGVGAGGGTTWLEHPPITLLGPRLRAEALTGSVGASDGRAGIGGVPGSMDDGNWLQRAARSVRQRDLAGLPEQLERFADAVLAQGGHLHWAAAAAEARGHIAGIVRMSGARRLVRSTSLLTDEIGLDSGLSIGGAEVVETALDAWILQTDLPASTSLRPLCPWPTGRPNVRAGAGDGSTPPPAGLGAWFDDLTPGPILDMVLSAEVGVTGAALAVAETGSVVLVPKGIDDHLVTALCPVQVVVVGMDTVTDTWRHGDLLLAWLTGSARAGCGLGLPSATAIVSGSDLGRQSQRPERLHVIVLDNGRSGLVAEEASDASAGIHCSSCRAALSPREQVAAGRLVQAHHARRREGTAWRLWAAAWSDGARYEATTHAGTWGALVARLDRKLPANGAWPDAGARPDRPTERFRDRWRKGLM
jgi:hypothetical protein